MIAAVEKKDILTNQLYLSKFAGVSMEYSDGLTLKDITLLTKQAEQWEKELRQANVRLEESKLRSLFKGLGKMFRKH